MPDYTTQDIRNVALVGHGGTGKTMLAEALLHKAGAITAKGEITRGTTVCDFDPQEKEHQHSLNSTIASLDYKGKHVNLLDTPGYPDFLGRALIALPAVETVAVVIDARSGIEMSTRRLMEAAAERGLCRMIIINKIDADDTPRSARSSARNACPSICRPKAARRWPIAFSSPMTAIPISLPSRKPTRASSIRWWKSTRR